MTMREYEADINGIKHTFQLSEEDAKARGLTAKDAKREAPLAESPLTFGEPTNKAQTVDAHPTRAQDPANPAATSVDGQGDGDQEGGEKSATPENKGRRASNKSE